MNCIYKHEGSTDYPVYLIRTIVRFGSWVDSRVPIRCLSLTLSQLGTHRPVLPLGIAVSYISYNMSWLVSTASIGVSVPHVVRTFFPEVIPIVQCQLPIRLLARR